MATDDFFAALDEAEERVGLEVKAKKDKVRYWYEEGYVPGNEKDSDEESTANESDLDKEVQAQDKGHIHEDTEEADEELSAKRVAPARSDHDSEDRYEDVVPQARGGRHVRWGGTGGKFCLIDQSPDEIPSLSEILDELMMPQADGLELSKVSSAAFVADKLEPVVVAVVEAQSQDCGRQRERWSHREVLDALPASAPAVDAAQIRERYSMERSEEGSQVRYREDIGQQQLTSANARLRKQAREEAIAKARSEPIEVPYSPAIRSSKEPLPGTHRSKVLSQAWQQRREAAATAASSGDVARASRSAFGAFALQGGDAVPKSRPIPRPGMAMLPGSLTGTTSRPRPLQVVGGPKLKLRGTGVGELIHTGPPLADSQDWPASADSQQP